MDCGGGCTYIHDCCCTCERCLCLPCWTPSPTLIDRECCCDICQNYLFSRMNRSAKYILTAEVGASWFGSASWHCLPQDSRFRPVDALDWPCAHARTYLPQNPPSRLGRKRRQTLAAFAPGRTRGAEIDLRTRSRRRFRPSGRWGHRHCICVKHTGRSSVGVSAARPRARLSIGIGLNPVMHPGGK